MSNSHKVRQKYDAFIDGVSIRSLTPLIKVTKIAEAVDRPDITLEPHPGAIGQIMMGNYRREMSVTITFVIAEIYDLAARAEAIDAVNAWAKAGKLEVNYRPGKCLFVNAVSEYVQIDGIKDFRGEYSITLSAYAFPYWVDAIPQTITSKVGSTERTIDLVVPGNQPTYLEMQITPESDLLITINIASSAGSEMEITTTTATGETLYMDYDINHLLCFRKDGSTSTYEGRLSNQSDDAIILTPGVNQITITANTTCDCVLNARGVYA